MNLKNLGTKLRKLRIESGLSIQNLCDILHDSNLPTTDKTVYKWETNKLYPDIKTLNVIANIYNISVGCFFDNNSTLQTLDETELSFINMYRQNENYKRIMLLLTKEERGNKNNGNKIVNET